MDHPLMTRTGVPVGVRIAFNGPVLLIPSRGLGREIVKVLCEAGYDAVASAQLGALIVMVTCEPAACEEALKLARKVDPDVVNPQ
jgi:hypothetical protein